MQDTGTLRHEDEAPLQSGTHWDHQNSQDQFPDGQPRGPPPEQNRAEENYRAPETGSKPRRTDKFSKELFEG